MNFDFDSEQNDLREAVRGLLERAYGDSEQRRKVVANDPGFDEKTWSRLAEMGLLGLPFAEEHGGMGAGPIEVAIVAEEIGRVIAPEPFIEAVVLAGGLIAAVGTDEQKGELLAAIAEGTTVPAFAHAEIGTRWSASAAAVTATRTGEGWTLSGVKEPVPNGAHADVLVVSALLAGDGAPGGTGLFVVQGDAAGLTRTGYRTHDGTRAANVRFDGTPATLLGGSDSPTHPDQTAAIERVLAEARIAYSHEAIGAMDTALRITAEYLKTRKQFGVTLNRFQALTFRAADMYVSLELARSTALWASMVQEAGGDVVSAADRARLQSSRAGRHVGKEAIQLHGGIGVTAEYSVGHYTSRLTAIDHLLGDGGFAVARLAEHVGERETVDPLGAPYA
ncbi:acyl-CoA dehydrogenase family protein [Blastococcus saxobsidens]|uniref:Putative acyl-CoA dehydrogenase Pimeloyl-CoA dehydrogenase pimD (Small subunit) n=1 Tax=Blastococcus saxobsidens (strain DD2) TaxID=1146883 RepID=H6RMN9_BLASD|nr:acyl-CoA dehydrogenase family protein [Blastococcus saxobsidens]CCG03874.1 Putative acyl-CoA dehydrogenase; Pimeloyl-CoA dehydrogenase pimD (Small subunit) [Blastococcus saxobsidens DD2]